MSIDRTFQDFGVRKPSPRLRRIAVGILISLLAWTLTWVCSQTLAFRKLDHLLNDAQQYWVGSERYFEDALVIDIDDATLRSLAPRFGAWPYSREVYALVTDYLTEHGARAIVLDILLADARSKDDVLARSMKKNRNTVLIAASSSDGTSLDALSIQRLQKFSWPLPANFPVTHWPSMATPSHAITDDLSANAAQEVRLGMVSAHPDVDGLLRRVPLFSEVDGVILPAIPLLVANRPGHALTVDAVSGQAALGGRPLPMDRQGNVHLAYPRNANSVLNMPFQQVAEAALGLIELEDPDKIFRGKTVFIGSTANIADRVATPRGPMSGTQVLAIAYENLRGHLMLKPPTQGWNAALQLMALVPALVITLLLAESLALTAVTMLGSGLALVGAHAWLITGQQEGSLLFALFALGTSWLLVNAHRAFALRQENAQLKTTSSTDALTGLLLRRGFQARLQVEQKRARRSQRPLFLAVLDIDHFKLVNDTHGHPGGDLVLKTFAGVLNDCIRNIDIAARWGGEEFVVALPDTGVQGALAVLERIRTSIETHTFKGMPEGFRVTVSAGLAEMTASMATLEDLIAAADSALYKAKEAGRNRVELHEHAAEDLLAQTAG